MFDYNLKKAQVIFTHYKVILHNETFPHTDALQKPTLKN